MNHHGAHPVTSPSALSQVLNKQLLKEGALWGQGLAEPLEEVAEEW